MSYTDINRIAEFMNLFANPLSLAIIFALQYENKTVDQIAMYAGADLNTVAEHIEVMEDKNVLQRDVDDMAVLYYLRDKKIINLFELVRIGLPY